MNINYEINAFQKLNFMLNLQCHQQTGILQKFIDKRLNIPSHHLRKQMIQQPKLKRFFELNEKIREIKKLLEKNCITICQNKVKFQGAYKMLLKY